MFKKLNPEQEKMFRQWARDHYVLYENIHGVWHPAVQDECVKMNVEAATFVEEPQEGA